MNDELDSALQRLAQDDVPPHLQAIEHMVIARVANHRFERPGAPMIVRVGAIAGALLMGVAGGLMPAEDAKAQPSLAPFAGASDLAPASLLLGKS